MFKKAERKKAKLRLAICAPSGAGKTYSALLMAKGLGGKVALIDTENGSGELYSNLFDYDVATIKDSFEVEKYIKAIKEADKGGYNVLIIDSLSHAWNAEGGILDQQNKATQASKSKNSYMAWKDVTPMQNSLINTILQSGMHVICTMRSKTAYEVQDGDNGRKTPVKVGLAPVQRADVEYEFTVVLDIATETHMASSSKDRTGLFDKKHFIISEETGSKLLEWLETGKGDDDEINEAINTIRACNNMQELKRTFEPYFLKFSRSSRLNEIIKAKDEMKTLIEEAQQKTTKEMNDVE